jgi:hypothetical protein
VKLKSYLIVLAASFLLVGMAPKRPPVLQCPPAPEPLGHVKVFQASSEFVAIVRWQSNERIYCTDEDFDDFVAVSHEDFSRIYSVLAYCYDVLD